MNTRPLNYFLIIMIFLIIIALPGLTFNNLLSTLSEESSDITLINGNIITMEPDEQQYSAVESKDSIITNLYDDSTNENDLQDNNNIIDVKGKTILPGFIDSHAHWIGDRDIPGVSSDEAISIALSYGWTSINEMFVNQERLHYLEQLDNESRLKLRVNAYLPINYQNQRFGAWYQAYEPHEQVSEKVRIGGVKLFMDNGPTLDYAGRSYWFGQAELNDIVKEAHDLGYQIAIHSGTDVATDLALTAINLAQGNDSNSDFRHRIEHATLLRDDQLTLMSELNTIVCAQFHWRNSDNLPNIINAISDNATFQLIARWRDVIDAGITFIGSTDTPWSVPNYFGEAITGIYRVVTRMGDQGIEPADWMLNQRLTVEEAIRALTIDGAYGTFEENVKGSIKIGKLADFVVLSENPLEASTDDLKNINVELTIIGGTVMYCSDNFEDICQNVDKTSSSSSEIQSTVGFEAISSLVLIVFIILKKTKKSQYK